MSAVIQPLTGNVLETKRLYMRPLDGNNDLADSVNLYGRAEENRYFESGPKTAEETAKYIDEFATQQFRDFPPFGIYVVSRTDNDEVIGHADFFTIDQERPGEDVEIGFILKSEHQGKGYGTEIAQGLTSYARDLHSQGNPRVKRLVATAHPENKGSWKILEKLGMQFLEQVEKFNGPRRVYELNLSKPELKK